MPTKTELEDQLAAATAQAKADAKALAALEAQLAAVNAPGDPAESGTVAPGDPVEALSDDPEGPSAADFTVGALVEHTYFDVYAGAGGQDVTQLGLVVAIDPDLGVVVSWLPTVGPIAFGELKAL